ncbi:MAG: hypothetical protein Kow00121_08520 [Elainellaceae cyanobacterium]
MSKIVLLLCLLANLGFAFLPANSANNADAYSQRATMDLDQSGWQLPDGMRVPDRRLGGGTR